MRHRLTRQERIEILSRRYWQMMRYRRWTKAADLHARMRELMLKELKWEVRTCKNI